MTLRQKVLLTFFLASALGTAIYTSYTYSLEKASVMRGIDRVLLAGAYALAHLYPGEFHERLTGPQAISEEEHQRNCRKLGILARQIGVKYLYSFLLYQGKVVFATSSASPGTGTKIIDDPFYDPFFSDYGSASVDLKKTFDDRKPVYETVADRAGTFRSVLMPFEMPDGRVFIAGADVEIDFIDAQMQKILWHYLLIGICIFLATAVIGLQTLSSVSSHLQKLTTAIQDLVKSEFAPIPETQRGLQEISERYRDEVGYLAGSFLTMQNALQSYLQNLARTTAQKEKIQSELRIAHNIQMSMVPRHFPNPTETGGLSLFAILEPAREVGGDFYDFTHLPGTPGRMVFAIGDVSGKGMPAALFMAMVKTLLKATISVCTDPAQVLGRLNDEMSRDNETSMFTTMQVGIIDLQTLEVTISNGGHNHPLLISADGAVRVMKLPNALPIGVYENMKFENSRFTLAVGETLALYTDGINEAMNERMEEFSDERFHAVLTAKHQLGLEQYGQGVFQEIRRFAGTQDPSDDATLLLIRVSRPDQKPSPENPETPATPLSSPPDHTGHAGFSLQHKTDLARLQDWLDGQAAPWNLSGPELHDLHLILDELVENALAYGVADDRPLEVKLEFAISPGKIDLRFSDTGKPFNPLLQPAPDISSAIEERKIGGWGIYLVRKCTDSVEYERQENRNVIRMSINRHSPDQQEGVILNS